MDSLTPISGDEAATTRLESFARLLGEDVPPVESYHSLNSARLGRRSSFFAQQAEKLVKLAAEHHAILPSDVLENIEPIARDTTEVNVFPKQDRVYKVTKGFNFFGYTLFCDTSSLKPRHIARIAETPSEYLARLALANRVFGSDNRFEGVVVDAVGDPHIVTSQHYFNSEEEDRYIQDIEIDEFMEQEGFNRLDGWNDWYRPADGLLVDDAHGGNFKRQKNGNVFPIDLMLLKIESEELKQWLETPQSEKSKEPIPAFTPPQRPELVAKPPRFPRLIAGLQRLNLVRKKEAEKQPSLEK